MKWKSFPPCYYFVLGMELRPWIGQASGPVYSGASSPVLMFVFRVTTLMVFLGLVSFFSLVWYAFVVFLIPTLPS